MVFDISGQKKFILSFSLVRFYPRRNLTQKTLILPYLRYLKNKCTKAPNLLRVVTHISCGADQQTLLHLHRSLIRSKLDYGCIVYGSAHGSYLQMLDLYRIMHCIYVLALIEPLHPPASVYSQTNHLSTSGGESSLFSAA